MRAEAFLSFINDAGTVLVAVPANIYNIIKQSKDVSWYLSSICTNLIHKNAVCKHFGEYFAQIQKKCACEIQNGFNSIFSETIKTFVYLKQNTL